MYEGSFFIPGKMLTTHQLLDVNKVHYILASANDIDRLVVDLKERINFYYEQDSCFKSVDELWETYAVSDRLDDAKTIFVKRVLQNGLPEKLRNCISSDLFKKYVGISEEKLAYELYMTADQISTMKRHGMFIGVHGYDHYWLGKTSEKEMQKDIDKALEVLEGLINPKAWVMNYPYGSYNEDVLDYIKKKGACVGFTTEVRVAEIGVDNPLILPRLDCIDYPPKSMHYKDFD